MRFICWSRWLARWITERESDIKRRVHRYVHSRMLKELSLLPVPALSQLDLHKYHGGVSSAVCLLNRHRNVETQPEMIFSLIWFKNKGSISAKNLNHVFTNPFKCLNLEDFLLFFCFTPKMVNLINNRNFFPALHNFLNEQILIVPNTDRYLGINTDLCFFFYM